MIFRGGDLFFSSLKLALVTSAWLPDLDTETTWGEVSSHEIAAGNGYDAGGKTLENVSVSDVEGGMKISSSQARWDASGVGIPAWRYMVLYISGTVGGVANPLIAFALGDDTPADVPVTPSGSSLFIPCPDGGWIELALPTAEDFATKAYADLQLVLAKAYADAKDLIQKAYTDAREAAILAAVEAGYVGFDDLGIDNLLQDATIEGSHLVTEADQAGEFAFNTQAAINTNDTSSFGHGEDGTPILANTVATYYDVEFDSEITSKSRFVLEVHSVLDNGWIPPEQAFVPSLLASLGSQIVTATSGPHYRRKGMQLSRVTTGLVRVYFFYNCAASSTLTSTSAYVDVTWAQVIAAVDGFDRWRVRKIG